MSESGAQPVPHAEDTEDTVDATPEEQEGEIEEQRQLVQLQQRTAERSIVRERGQIEEATVPEEDRHLEDGGQTVSGEAGA